MTQSFCLYNINNCCCNLPQDRIWILKVSVKTTNVNCCLTFQNPLFKAWNFRHMDLKKNRSIKNKRRYNQNSNNSTETKLKIEKKPVCTQESKVYMYLKDWRYITLYRLWQKKNTAKQKKKTPKKPGIMKTLNLQNIKSKSCTFSMHQYEVPLYLNFNAVSDPVPCQFIEKTIVIQKVFNSLLTLILSKEHWWPFCCWFLQLY